MTPLLIWLKSTNNSDLAVTTLVLLCCSVTVRFADQVVFVIRVRDRDSGRDDDNRAAHCEIALVAPSQLLGKLAYSSPRSLKSAVTDLAESMLTVHLSPETLSHPVHPPKPDSKAGAAVSVTVVPLR